MTSFAALLALVALCAGVTGTALGGETGTNAGTAGVAGTPTLPPVPVPASAPTSTPTLATVSVPTFAPAPARQVRDEPGNPGTIQMSGVSLNVGVPGNGNVGVVLGRQPLVPGGPGYVYAGEIVRVRLGDGRTLTGEVDADTAKDLLWLHMTAPSIAISSSIPWSQIIAVHYGGRELSAADFRPLAEKLKSKFPCDFLSSETPQEGGVSKATDTGSHSQHGLCSAFEAAAYRPSQNQKVCSLRIEATLARWDQYVDATGVEVRIFPLAQDGSIVPVDATLDVRLIGMRLGGPSTREVFPELGSWGEMVHGSDYGTWGAVYRFRFQNVHPEFDFNFTDSGLVNVKLGVSGQGIFEASESITLRPSSWLRDELQQREHKRFFSAVRTGWGGR